LHTCCNKTLHDAQPGVTVAFEIPGFYVSITTLASNLHFG
jgi:hypothetical protein